MRDAYGGIMNIVLLVTFFLIVEGVLGLIVGYTKAFKMKNIVISTVEEYEASGCFNDGEDTACISRIKERASRIGYRPTSLNCSEKENLDNIDNLLCYKPLKVKTDNYSGNRPTSYRITTQVDITFPLIDKVLGFNFFQISGDTRVIEHQVGK